MWSLRPAARQRRRQAHPHRFCRRGSRSPHSWPRWSSFGAGSPWPYREWQQSCHTLMTLTLIKTGHQTVQAGTQQQWGWGIYHCTTAAAPTQTYCSIRVDQRYSEEYYLKTTINLQYKETEIKANFVAAFSNSSLEQCCFTVWGYSIETQHHSTKPQHRTLHYSVKHHDTI